MRTLLPLDTNDAPPSSPQTKHISSDGDHLQLEPFHPLLATTADSFANLSDDTNNLLFPAEKAYDRLLSLFMSRHPWQVNSELLFGICHILEESLPFSRPISDPSSHTLVSVLHKMRTWRHLEERSLLTLASDLAGLVDVEPSTPRVDTFNSNARPKSTTPLRSGEADDKENTPAHGETSRRHTKATKSQKRTQRKYSLDDVFGEPVPSFNRRCVVCAALKSALNSDGNLPNVQRALHHTHDYDGLAFPRPPPPASASLSRSRSKPFQENLPLKLADSPQKVQPIIYRRRTALASLNGEFQLPNTSSFKLSTSPPRSLQEDEADASLGEIWLKRRSQEEGWRR